MNNDNTVVSSRKVTLLLDLAQIAKESIERIQRNRKAPLKKWEVKLLEMADKALNEPYNA